MNVELGGYRFSKADDTLIEVYDLDDDEFPASFIRVRLGDIDTEKSFQLEVMDWLSKNSKN